jgi:hypothetical protein
MQALRQNTKAEPALGYAAACPAGQLAVRLGGAAIMLAGAALLFA